MSRSWKQERTTRKEPVQKAPRPRMSDFAREYYQGKGYESVDTVTALCDAEEEYLLDSRGMHP